MKRYLCTYMIWFPVQKKLDVLSSPLFYLRVTNEQKYCFMQFLEIELGQQALLIQAKKIWYFLRCALGCLTWVGKGWLVWETWQLLFKVLLWKHKWVLQIQVFGSEGMMHLPRNYSVSSIKSSFPKSFKHMFGEKKIKEGVSFSIYPIAQLQCAGIDQAVS